MKTPRDPRYYGLYFEALYTMIVPRYRERVRVDVDGRGRTVTGTVVAGTEDFATVWVDGTGKYMHAAWRYVQALPTT